LSSSTFHLDTSVLLPMLDKKSHIVSKDETKAFSRFRYNLEHNNNGVKTSLVVLGELFTKVLEECSPDDSQDIAFELLSFSQNLNGRLKCCAEKFRHENQEFYSTLENLLGAEDRLRDNPTDALILSIATLDAESDVFYTTDTLILFNKRIRAVVDKTRSDCGFKPLKISPAP